MDCFLYDIGLRHERVNAKLKKQNEKKNGITFSISKTFATNFDHWLDLTEAHN